MAEDVGDGSTGQRPEIAQPTHFEFDEHSAAAIDVHVAKYPQGREASAVIAALYEVQKQMKRQTGSAWVPRLGMDAVAVRLNMAPIRVYEVATFYLMFNTNPIGRHHLQICTTTPCWLRGSDEVEATCRRVTGIKGWLEPSAAGMFTMSQVECLCACVNAPIIHVDDDYYEDLDGPATERLLAALARGERPQPGSMAGRQTSAPEGGPVTLLTITE